MRNENVIRAWLNGQRASAGNLSTDGSNLYSYNLLIGEGSGTAIFNHTAGGGSYYSQTTSTHVGLAKRLATCAKVVNP
jgi:hypothetical protein